MTHFNQKHGHAATRTGTYRSWESMKARCRNQKNPDYTRYGGRGIGYAPEWEKFETFLTDMGDRPFGTSLDRIDCDGNYAPGNCRWATIKEQNSNKSGNRVVHWNGVDYNIAQLAEATGQPYQRLHERIIRRGWSVDRAINEAPRGWRTA